MLTLPDNTQNKNVLLPLVDIRAIELRFEGWDMKKISEILKLEGFDKSYGCLRNDFCKSGRLHDLYVDYVRREAETREEQARDMFKAHLGSSVQNLITLANKSRSDMVRLMANKEIINRQLGETAKMIKVQEVRDPARDILEKAGILEGIIDAEVIEPVEEVKTITNDTAGKTSATV